MISRLSGKASQRRVARVPISIDVITLTIQNKTNVVRPGSFIKDHCHVDLISKFFSGQGASMLLLKGVNDKRKSRQ